MLLGMQYTSGFFYGVLAPGVGGTNLVSFDGSSFNANPTLNTIGSLPSGVSAFAVNTQSFAPEPEAWWLLGGALAGLEVYRRMRGRRAR
jgi:hypothetical protein